MRSRVLVVLGSEAFEIGLNRVVDLDTRMSQITRVWVQDAANLFIERVYGWLATELGANGVDIRVVTGAGPEKNGLAAMVRMDKVAMLPRMGVNVVGWPWWLQTEHMETGVDAMSGRWYARALCAGVLGLASFGCRSETVASIPREGAVETPVVAAPIVEPVGGGQDSTAVSVEAIATPTAYALGVPSPRVVTATPIVEETAEIPVEGLDCSVFDSAEAAQAAFLSVGGPLDDGYSLDTNRDGIACNADTDAGADGRRWAFSDSDGPGPAGTIQPTTTPDPQEPPKPPGLELQRLDLWEIDWGFMQNVGVVRIVKVGERLLGSGDLPISFAQYECGPNVGSELTGANWTWDEEERSGWIWVDVPESEADYCVAAYWGSETDFFPLPVYPRDSRKVRPRVPHMSDGLVFRVDHEWRNYDIPPSDPREGGAIRFRGNTPDPIPSYTAGEPHLMIELDGKRQPLLCGPEMMPAAIWTHEEGFVPLTIEEEQAYAKLQAEWPLLASLKWNEEMAEARKEAEKLGWYFVLGNRGTWPFFCWNLANQEELPDTTPCLECYERK